MKLNMAEKDSPSRNSASSCGVGGNIDNVRCHRSAYEDISIALNDIKNAKES